MSTAARPAVIRPTKPQRSTIDRRPAWESISRGVGVFWGMLLLLQVFLWGDSYTVWWLGDLPFPSTAQRGGSALFGVLLLVYGFTEREPKIVRGLTWTMTGLLLGFSLLQVWNWYAAKEAGMIDSPVRVPFVLQVTGVLSVIFAGLSQPGEIERGRQGGLLLAIIAFDLCLLVVPLSHFYCLGQTTDAIPSLTILFSVDDLSDPSADAAHDLSRYFSITESTHLLLIGSENKTAAWQENFQPLTDQHDLKITMTAGTSTAGHQLQSQLEKFRAEEEVTSVLLVGSPLQISPLRIRTLRAGLKPRQLVMERESLTLESALRAIPELWLTYLPIRKQDRL
ncbi:MAG: hypothetical protein P8M30_07425 [Planctomycetaceae bacterium]|nr:hypothetical protein [Planctomycetaceae bacterium]